MNDQQTVSSDPIIRINELRAKQAAGEEITKEEAAEAVRLLRRQRAKSVTPAKKSTLPTDLTELFGKK